MSFTTVSNQDALLLVDRRNSRVASARRAERVLGYDLLIRDLTGIQLQALTDVWSEGVAGCRGGVGERVLASRGAAAEHCRTGSQAADVDVQIGGGGQHASRCGVKRHSVVALTGDAGVQCGDIGAVATDALAYINRVAATTVPVRPTTPVQLHTAATADASDRTTAAATTRHLHATAATTTHTPRASAASHAPGPASCHRCLSLGRIRITLYSTGASRVVTVARALVFRKIIRSCTEGRTHAPACTVLEIASACAASHHSTS